jgi:glutamate formiminotransferase / 5-formyltetrahydrofolate cyclo-ligase
MEKIVECIPNFSEGRDLKKVDQIVAEIESVDGVFLLGRESDYDHNRSVITFAGEPKAVIEAAFLAIKKAAELIDLNKHEGEHPRMGATDVCPFVPLKGITMSECISLAEKLAERVARELEIPSYLYEEATRKPERKNLATIRKGQYEGIKTKIADSPERAPDFGPKELGPAGITAIGVRGPLIAYNVNLQSKDLKIAKKIARTIRHSNGGLEFVKALGLELPQKGIVQVSMNLTNYKKTPPLQVFDLIKSEAKKHGVEILESEIIGLIPEDALFEGAEDYLKITDFKQTKILKLPLHSSQSPTEQSEAK